MWRESRRVRHSALGLMVGAAHLLWRAIAHGASPPPGVPTIEWEAPSDCPDAAWVQAEVVSMLGASSHAQSPGFIARATVVATGPASFTMRVRIEARGTSESKTLQAETCATLADAFAVVVAFTADPGAGALQAPGMERSSAEVRADSSDERVRPLSQSSGSAFSVGIGPVAALSAGLLPSPAYAVGATVAVEEAARWELAATYWPEQSSWVPSSVSLDATRTYGASIHVVSIRPSVCWPLGRSALGLCAGAEVGAMVGSGTGTGVASSDSGWSWWFAPSGALFVHAPIGQRLDMRFRLDLGIPVFRPSFVLQHVGASDSVQAYRPAPVFAVLSFEPELHFSSTGSGVAGHGHESK